MKPHEERVVQEQQELQTKITKLAQFVDLLPLPDVGIKQQVLLEVQLRTMRTYNEILLQRIELFK